MGGGCACHKNIKKYFSSSADFEIIKPNYKINLPKKNDNISKTNIQIMPKSDIENIVNFKSNIVHNTDKTKFLSLNKNNISSITNKKRHSLYNIEDKKKNMLFNDINNENLSDNSMSSDNSKKKDNNHLAHIYQINSSLSSNQINNELFCKDNSPCKKILKNVNEKDINKVKKLDTSYNYNLGEHNFIFINISRGSSFLKNDVENVESATPKLAIGKTNLEDMSKGKKKIFSHFCQNKSNEKHQKNQSNNNNQPSSRKKENFDIKAYMSKYSKEMINAINSIRKNPEYFLQSIDDVINNNIQRINDDIFIVSKNVNEKIKIIEDYFLVFEQIKGNLREIINSKNLPKLEEFKYNEELEISLNDTQEIINKESCNESSFNNENNNNQIKKNNSIIKKKKKESNSTLDLSDDKIATLILSKRKKIKNKYPENVFKMSIIKDIKISILIQISMEILDHQFCEKKLLEGIIFNPLYKNFAISWANEINRKFISISCFA